MYQLLVYYPGSSDPHPTATVVAEAAADVFVLIPKLLAEHDGCERVVVMLHASRLFSVDCAGNREP